MCGLVGVAGDTGGNVKDIFTELLIIDSVRGMHSTGVGVARRWKNEIVLAKTPGPSHFLIVQEEYRKAIQDAARAIVGHNRLATIGAHTRENAHPFVFDKIIGAHNGTLDKDSRKKLFNYEAFGTDSEAIFANIAMFGIEATVELLQGAWALTWYDGGDNTINFLRNNKRPLHYCYSKDRCTLFWASELEMLEFALKRHKAEPENDTYFSVDTDTHLSWQIPEFMNGKFSGPVKTEMKAPPPPPVTVQVYQGGYGGGWREVDNRGGKRDNVVPFKGDTHQHGSTGGTKNMGMLFSNRINTQQWRPPYKDSTGKVINKKAFNRLVADGCVFCEQTDSEWGDFIKPFKDSDGHSVYLCEECYNDDDIFQLCQNMI